MSSIRNFTFIFYYLFFFMLISPLIGVGIVNSLSVLISLISLILIFIDKKILEFYKNKHSLFLVLLFSFILISSISSNYNIISLKETWPSFLYLPYTIFLYLISLNTKLFLKIFYLSLLTIFCLLFIYLIYQIILIRESVYTYNYTSLFSNKVLGNYTIKFFPLIIGLTLYYLNITKNRKLILILISVFLISIFMIIASGQRTSFFKFFICCFFYFF